jgi:type I restriction enzyme S subunit
MREGWIESSLEEIAEVIMGQSPDGKTYNHSGDGLPFIQGSAEFGEHHPTPEKWCSNPKKIAEPGDLLLSVRAPVGDTNLADQRIAVGRGLSVIRANSNSVTEFIRLVIQLNVAEMIASSGTGMFASITGKNLKEFKVLLPPLPEQKRIVDLISSIDSYLESLRIALVKSINARKSALESQLDSLSHTSPVFRLEELCATGKSAIVDGPFGANLKREDYLEEGIPVLKIQNIKQDYIVIKKMDYVSEDKFQELRRHSFQQGDIVMTKLGDPLGLSAIVRQLDKGLIVADLVRIRPDKIDVEFLCMQLNSAKIQNYINRMQKGSTRPRVNLGMIREMPIAVPSDTKISEFVAVFGAWSEQNRNLEETIRSTEQLRSGLLSDLLSGNHEIPGSYDKFIGAA